MSGIAEQAEPTPGMTPGLGHALRRYAKTLRLFWGCTLAAQLEYRSNFLISTLNSILGLLGSIFGLFLFYRTGALLGGWEWEEALMVMGMFTLLEGFSSSLLAPNLNRIVAHVREGTMDFVLLKPIDSQFWLSTRNISVWGTPNIGFGLFIMVFAGLRLRLPLSGYLYGLVPLGLGFVILYGMWFALAATSVWFVKVHNVTYVLRSFLEAGRYPVAAYPAFYRLFFTFVVPVTFLTTVPAEVMLGRPSPAHPGLAALLAVGVFAGARGFWRFSLRFYTSASS